MKKIVFVGLIALLFISCGKVEKGSITIENKSTHEVVIEFAQNYSSEFITLQPSDSISRSWERYFHCIIEKPSTNILKRQQTKEKITILNNDNLYTYTVINGVCPLKMLDNNQSILASSTYTVESFFELPQKTSKIKTFRPLSVKNIIFDKGASFDIDGVAYYPIEKKKDGFYYFNKDIGGNLSSKRINIDFVDNEIIITN